MNRHDMLGLAGLILLVAGIGGGIELTLLGQSRAYSNLIAAGGNANPAAFADEVQQATQFVKLGIPMGMFGIVLLAFAARGYLRSAGATTRPAA